MRTERTLLHTCVCVDRESHLLQHYAFSVAVHVHYMLRCHAPPAHAFAYSNYITFTTAYSTDCRSYFVVENPEQRQEKRIKIK